MYAAALAVAWWVFRSLGVHPLVDVLAGMLAAMAVTFAATLVWRNGSVFDAYWSVVPPLVALHLGRMKDNGTLRPEHMSMGKMGNVRGAIEACRTARTILGGNGITLEYPVIRHMNNLESVVTYEGTADVHALVVGGAVTGMQAFR